jgi:hypothetical protein
MPTPLPAPSSRWPTCSKTPLAPPCSTCEVLSPADGCASPADGEPLFPPILAS